MVEYNEFSFSELTVDEMREGIKQRIKQYEANIFDAILNQKAEAASRNNPRRQEAVRVLQRQIDDLTAAVEVCKMQLELLEMPVAEEVTHE